MNWREVLEARGPHIGGAVSGGLDSCTVTHWLNEKGFRVEAFTVDLGQPDEEDVDAVADRMVACGAEAAHIVPGKEALVREGIKVIQAQARYEGGYWNTTWAGERAEPGRCRFPRRPSGGFQSLSKVSSPP